MIDDKALTDWLYQQKVKSMQRRGAAKNMNHYEEVMAYTHEVNVYNKVLAMVRGMKEGGDVQRS